MIPGTIKCTNDTSDCLGYDILFLGLSSAKPSSPDAGRKRTRTTVGRDSKSPCCITWMVDTAAAVDQ